MLTHSFICYLLVQNCHILSHGCVCMHILSILIVWFCFDAFNEHMYHLVVFSRVNVCMFTFPGITIKFPVGAIPIAGFFPYSASWGACGESENITFLLVRLQTFVNRFGYVLVYLMSIPIIWLYWHEYNNHAYHLAMFSCI